MQEPRRKEGKDREKEIKRDEIEEVIRKLKERLRERMGFRTSCGNMRKKRNDSDVVRGFDRVKFAVNRGVLMKARVWESLIRS